MKGLRESFQLDSAWKTKRPPISTLLGMRLVRYGGGRATMAMNTSSRFHNPMGTVHGGIITDLADAAMGIALISTLGKDESFTTLELKMNFLRPVFRGRLTAEGRVLHRGRTIALVEAVVKHARKVVARGVATQMVIHPHEPVAKRKP